MNPSEKTNVKILKAKKKDLIGKRDYLEGKLHEVQGKLDETDALIEELEEGDQPDKSDTICKTFEDEDGNAGFMSIKNPSFW